MRSVASQGTRLGTDSAPSGVAARVRTLRKHAGLTQTELAGERFSKEYVSQIELGKTKPSAEAIEYLAARLDVDPLFLETGVSSDERGRIEATLARGEALIESQSYEAAAQEFSKARTIAPHELVPELRFRALCGEAWALIRLEGGDQRRAMKLLEEARGLAERPRFSDIDRAEVLYRMGVCRYKLSSLQTAISLFTEALALANRSELPCDRLRADIYRWRSRCYRRQRDWAAAREDVELALELAESVEDPRELANTLFQASLIAERNGHWVLARTYAERAKNEYERLADKVNHGRLLNNLGAFNFMLGKPEEAERLLKDAFRLALDNDNEVDAAYAINSLARVHLETGKPERGETQARKALELLDGREDYLDEIGNAQLVLGRSLLDQGQLTEADEWLKAAEQSFEQIGSPGHRSAALVARGDLATRQEDDALAARLYRKAAELLQDVRF
jgi:tetratricopeptide (TPR) repeat protein